MEVSLPKAAVAEMAKSKLDAMTLSTPEADITFDKASMSTLLGEATEDIKTNVSKVDAAGLSETAKAVVGDRPVFNIGVTSGSGTISQFGGTITASLPYTPKAGEDLNAIIIYYINAEGKLQMVNNCKYDPTTGRIVFTTNHFSMYALDTTRSASRMYLAAHGMAAQ